MKIHLISTGGSIMHNLAIALQKAGHEITGSDDEIYDPARTRLSRYGLLPAIMGWDKNNVSEKLDLCIIGMHARADNPELIEAQRLGIPIYSFPEYVYDASKEKLRIVVAGSHGKTTTTSIILHVLKECKQTVDYLVGAQLDGFEEMVHLSNAPTLVVEGDEYLSSAIDRRPKFIHYKAHIAIITGIAWDHMNVFKTFDDYKRLFIDLLESLEPGATVFYYENDEHIKDLLLVRDDLQYIPYNMFPYSTNQAEWSLKSSCGEITPVKLFGEHNMQNIQAAWCVCQEMGISENDFLAALGTFKGAAKRMQLIRKNEHSFFYQDFAHAPSKVKATTSAVRHTYPNHRLVTCVELHTFSSLSKEFIPQYQKALDGADVAIVFYQEHTLRMKKLPPLDENFVKEAFDFPGLLIIQKPKDLETHLKSLAAEEPTIFLMMSSGTFGGTDLTYLSDQLLNPMG